MDLGGRPELWIGFTVMVVVLLVIDLGVFNRHAHKVRMREALIWSAVWIALSLIFNVFVYLDMGGEAGTAFLTGYLIEKSLSVDNLFVFLVIFSYYQVKPEYQHRVLFWGIIGAIVLRAVMIVLGAALIQRFEWILYIFGAFLVYTAYKLAFAGEGAKVDPEHNRIVRFAGRVLPMTDKYHGEKFFIVQNGKRFATPMLLVLITIETSDVMFALDSIPAIFGITRDPFIVYTSNIFAILGLRALYFVLADFMDRFRYLDVGLAIVLGFIGVKMLLHEVVHIPTGISLAIVATILTVAVVASLKAKPEAPGEGVAGVEPPDRPHTPPADADKPSARA